MCPRATVTTAVLCFVVPRGGPSQACVTRDASYFDAFSLIFPSPLMLYELVSPEIPKVLGVDDATVCIVTLNPGVREFRPFVVSIHGLKGVEVVIGQVSVFELLVCLPPGLE